MTKIIRLLTLICAFAVTQAFASGPESASASEQSASPPPSSDAAAQSAAAPSASSTTTGDKSQSTSSTSKTDSDAAAKQAQGSTPNRVVLNDKTLTQAQVHELMSQGYKPRASGDSIYYCRSETQLGSRFETKVCRTAEQIFLQMRDAKEMVDRMTRAPGANPNVSP